jgi:Flp pilus assembly protein TadG
MLNTNWKRNKGAAIVEFALGFMLFIMMLVGLMEFGRAVWVYTTVAQATRQGARYAVVHGSANPATADQIASVVAANAVGLDPNNLTVTTTWSPANQRGAVVQVQVRYNLNLVAAPLIVKQNTLTLGSSSNMIVAN